MTLIDIDNGNLGVVGHAFLLDRNNRASVKPPLGCVSDTMDRRRTQDSAPSDLTTRNLSKTVSYRRVATGANRDPGCGTFRRKLSSLA